KEYVIVKLSDPMKCSESITKEFNKGNNKVWVVGNCVIYPSLNIQDTAGSITPRSLVVENGIFASAGSTVFDGSFYHL
ncbi:hypothetical protein CGH44_25755, partial [Vibrio parahaemolyticus]